MFASDYKANLWGAADWVEHKATTNSFFVREIESLSLIFWRFYKYIFPVSFIG